MIWSATNVFDAVDESVEKIASYGDLPKDCNAIRFRLNGIVYAAVEDPQDGYRSSMRELLVVDVAMVNVFPPVPVTARHRIEGKYGEQADVLEVISVATGKTVLEIGTSNTDDYYPTFVGRFDPTGIA